MQAVQGRFTGSGSTTGWVGPALECYYSTSSDAGGIFAYNRTTGTAKDLQLGQGISPRVLLSGTVAVGSMPNQLLGAGTYISTKLGIGQSAPNALLHIAGIQTSPTMGIRSGYRIADDTASILLNANFDNVNAMFFGRKTINQNSAHTILNYYKVVFEKDTAGTNSTIVRNRVALFNGQVKIVDSLLLGNLQTGTSGDSVLVWNRTDSAVKMVAQSSLGGTFTIGTFSNTATAKGLDFTASVLTAHAADGSNAGMLKGSGSQTIAPILTMPAPLFTGTTSAGVNDSILTIDPATGQTHWRNGTFTLKVANGLTASSGGDTLFWGGTLIQNTNILGAGFTASLGTSGSKLSALSVYADNITLTPSAGGTLSLYGHLQYGSNATSADANATAADVRDYYLGSTLTANRTVALSGFGEYGIFDNGTSAFKWTPTQAFYISNSDSITSLANGANYTVVYDGNHWAVKSLSPGIGLVQESSAGTLTLATATDYVFNGTTTTWTLPILNSNQGRRFHIKNAGSGNITLNRGGSDNIYDASSVTSLTITPGQARILIAGSSFWYVE
jgi:hypothetical protein